MPIVDAALEGARTRFRAVLMTSFAFIAGLIPLVTAEGAAMLSRRAVGTGVAGGMLAATLLGIFVIPSLYVVFQRRPRAGEAAPRGRRRGRRSGERRTPAARDAAPLLAGLRHRRGALRPARRADAGRHGLGLLPHPRPQLHPARIPVPHPLRRRPPRPPARGARRRPPSPAPGCPSAPRASTSPASGSARPASPPGRETAVDADAAGAARLRLATCGGAVLFVNGTRGRPPRPLHPQQGSERRARRRARAPARNALAVFFDDLAERDTRFHFQLDWLDGPRRPPGAPVRRGPRDGGRGRGRARGAPLRPPRLRRRRGPLLLPAPAPAPGPRLIGRRRRRPRPLAARGRPGVALLARAAGPARRLPPRSASPCELDGFAAARDARHRDRPRRRAGPRPTPSPPASPRRWRRSPRRASPTP